MQKCDKSRNRKLYEDPVQIVCKEHYERAPVVQWIEQQPSKLPVAGSSPAGRAGAIEISIIRTFQCLPDGRSAAGAEVSGVKCSGAKSDAHQILPIELTISVRWGWLNYKRDTL
jgi:hypothetical protein